MKNLLRSSLACAAFAVSSAGFARAQNMIVNGDFETVDASIGGTLASNGSVSIPITPADDPYYFVPNWYAASGAITLHKSGNMGITTADGGNFITLGNTFEVVEQGHGVTNTFRRAGGLQMIDMMGLVEGATYTFSFDVLLVSSDVNWTRVGVSITGTDGVNPAQGVFDTEDRYYFDTPATPDKAHITGPRWVSISTEGWVHVEISFEASFTADYWLSIYPQAEGVSTTPYGSTVAFDNISLVAATAVPEPATYAAICGAGVLGLALWRRRRAANYQPKRLTPRADKSPF